MNHPRFVTPQVYFIGHTAINHAGLLAYLHDSGNSEFVTAMRQATEQGLSDAEILCSFYAKLCYRALSKGKNVNVTKTRDIWDNVIATFDSAHGSVFEHVNFSFIINNCSRVETHEHVRHRIGVAYSQTSGRYCRYDFIPIVWDPVLNPVGAMWIEHMEATEKLIYLTECKLGLRVPPEGLDPDVVDPERCFKVIDLDSSFSRYLGTALKDKDVEVSYVRRMFLDYQIIRTLSTETQLREAIRWVPNDAMPFAQKKKLTSAVRRIIPQGVANELGFSCNLRALRHMIQMRTAAAAEWEIRCVFDQIYRLLKPMFPLAFYGAQEREVDGLLEISGMKQNPYEKTANEVLGGISTEELQSYLKTRETMAV